MWAEMKAPTFNPSIQEEGAGGARGQPGLQSKTRSQNKTKPLHLKQACPGGLGSILAPCKAEADGAQVQALPGIREKSHYMVQSSRLKCKPVENH